MVSTLTTPGGNRSPMTSINSRTGKRRQACRFKHYAVTAASAGAIFPACHQQRKVPRDYLPHDAKRFVKMVTRFRYQLHADPPPAHGRRNSGNDRSPASGGAGFSRIGLPLSSFRCRQQFEVLFHPIGDLKQMAARSCTDAYAPTYLSPYARRRALEIDIFLPEEATSHSGWPVTGVEFLIIFAVGRRNQSPPIKLS